MADDTRASSRTFEVEGASASATDSCLGSRSPAAGRIAPLLRRLEQYDALRRDLECRGGSCDDLQCLVKLLRNKITCGTGAIDQEHDQERNGCPALEDPEGVRRFVELDPSAALRFDVRMNERAWPVFFIGRVWGDGSSGFTPVIEEVYRSPGYRTADERFIRFIGNGREESQLNLSPLRGAADRMIDGNVRDRSPACDALLVEAGRCVLRAAWHEDQSPGILIADRFGIAGLRETIETVYLCLNAETRFLRGESHPMLLAFFEKVYRQPLIRTFIEIVRNCDGHALGRLERGAREAYARLQASLGRFLAREVKGGNGATRLPLCKFVFANFSRLHAVAGMLGDDRDFAAARRRLSAESRRIAADWLAVRTEERAPWE